MAYELYVQRRQQCLVPIIIGAREDLDPRQAQSPHLDLFLRVNNYLEHGERWFWEKLTHTSRHKARECNFDNQDMVEMADNPQHQDEV